jgi:protein gp37
VTTRSAIEWTGDTWNPVTGCDRVSEGCDHCYALTLAKRLKAMGNPRYQLDGDPRTSGPGFGLTLHEDKLEEPLRWRAPRPVFVNSMSDLFHKAVPLDFIERVLEVMTATPQHVYQVLTKRPARMASILRRLQPDPLPNVWWGTSVENQKWADVRIPHLLRTPATVRFLSVEPLLGPVDLRSAMNGHLDALAGDAKTRDGEIYAGGPGIDWVIVGGESGPGYRALDLDWARRVRDQCVAADVAFFFKQVGGRTPKAGGSLLDGEPWTQLPPQTPPEILAYLGA